MNKLYSVLILILFSVITTAQVKITGVVIDNDSKEPLSNVKITLEPSYQKSTTNKKGFFTLKNVKKGVYTLNASADNAEFYSQELKVEKKDIQLPLIALAKESNESGLTFVNISSDELADDESSVRGSTTFLQANRDAYSKVAAYEWGGFFFSPRGLDSRMNKVLFNGVEMNNVSNGRPDWKNWGGLNDVTRYPETSFGAEPGSKTLGTLGGTTSFSTRASSYRKGTSISGSLTNRSYTQRVLATYSSGLLDNGWAFTVSGSRRWAQEGVIDGTLYDATAFFGAVEKKLNDNHSLNLTVFGAPYRRGSNAPHTQEVYDLFGTHYNSYWGWHNGEKRNERIKTNFEPVAQLTHYWGINEKSDLETTLSFQKGYNGSTRLNRYNASSVSPSYYKYLPSYSLSNGGIFSDALIFNNNNELLPVINQQINWNYVYNTNLLNYGAGENIGDDGRPGYVMVDDRNDDQTMAFNTSLKSQLSDKVQFTGALNIQNFQSENYRKVEDLLGANGVRNIDPFDMIQNDLNNPNTIAKEGDKIDYHYNIDQTKANLYTMFNIEGDAWDFYIGGDLAYSQSQRDGKMLNENYANSSYGKSENQIFTNFGVKGGATYKINGFNALKMNVTTGSFAPTMRELFPNQRFDNTATPNIQSSYYSSADLSYYLKSQAVKAKATLYYNRLEDLNNVNYYFTQNDTFSTFVTEVTRGIFTQHIGAELGAEVNVTPNLTATVGANYGQYTYDNNPDVYLFGEDLDVEFNLPNGQNVFYAGKAALENYKIASGPQHAYSVGAQYRTNNYWRFGFTGNYLGNNYVSPATIRRTPLFSVNPLNGTVYDGYTEAEAKRLLRQEQFDGHFYVNFNAGKTWRWEKYFIGFNLNVNNVLNNKDIRTGGFEQGRLASFTNVKEDADRDQPVFGNKYWYNQGVSFFTNFFVRF